MQGWLPLDKADLQLDAVTSPAKSIGGASGVDTPAHSDDPASAPITLICGNNFVQLQAVRLWEEEGGGGRGVQGRALGR